MDGGAAGDVTVKMFTAVPGPHPAGMIEETGWATQLADSDMVGTIGLGSLVALCLGLMFLMLRRSSTSTISESTIASAEASPGVDVEIVDEVEDSQVVLEGIEIGDEAVRRSVMLEQIKSSVQNSPEEVAHVLRRWVRTES